MGLLLLIIAIALLGILFIPVVLVGTVYTLFKHTGNKYYKTIAVSVDQFGNVICGPLFNLILIKDGYSFGALGETISSVLGKNERDKTLTILGRSIAYILNKIDKDHCKNSIKD